MCTVGPIYYGPQYYSEVVDNPLETYYRKRCFCKVLDMRYDTVIHLSSKSFFFMVDVRIDITISEPCPADRRHFVKVLLRWATGKRLTNRLPSPSLATAVPS